jgi:hypothetical protein
LDHNKDCRVLSLKKVLNSIVKLAVTCSCSLLIACEPLIFGGIAGVGGPSTIAVTQCASGPADLAGVCRNTSSLTPGALEAVGLQVASAAALNVSATAQSATSGSTLNIAWSPYPGSAAGYFVYYGPTSDTASTLASDLPNGAVNFDASAPSISYQPTLDLGLNTGENVCFRIFAYDSARVLYDWSTIQCVVV